MGRWMKGIIDGGVIIIVAVVVEEGIIFIVLSFCVWSSFANQQKEQQNLKCLSWELYWHFSKRFVKMRKKWKKNGEKTKSDDTNFLGTSGAIKQSLHTQTIYLSYQLWSLKFLFMWSSIYGHALHAHKNGRRMSGRNFGLHELISFFSHFSIVFSTLFTIKNRQFSAINLYFYKCDDENMQMKYIKMSKWPVKIKSHVIVIPLEVEQFSTKQTLHFARFMPYNSSLLASVAHSGWNKPAK